ncbi:uncharacterized protein EV420DRAFT_1669942 [Desarmillaria tabescens]|uniref:Protein kinase domain-containing protein n=1 Tax=Armillaria tabescens TaxID=1929756 RepID=A0AA39MK61_ARMTA|nr:uncharacterized protein EV420DRAFT_1669942 [Desarmillaria tabescens]KAK0437297.1 hypothetical protein EV420DRAFT_1669942 [Desarmillaria tabescens]
MTGSRAQSASFGLPEVNFEHLFGLVPSPLEQDPDSDIPKPDSLPITFFDKHLDDSLILKKVTVLPSLVSTLSEALDDYISTFNSKNESFSSPRLYLSPEFYDCVEPPKNAADIAERYRLGAPIFLQAASILVIHPDQPDLKAVFWMNKGRPGPPEGFHSQKHSLKYDAHTRKDMLERLEPWNPDQKALLLSMWDNIPELAIWDIYALPGQYILEDMSRLATLDVFPWKHCGVSGHRQFAASTHVSRPDVSKYLWETAYASSSGVVPAGVDAAHPRRSERLKGRPSAKSLPQVAPKKKSARPLQVKEPAAPKIVVPKSAHGTQRYKANAADFVQRAWARAVHSDSTFIIFDCGNFLRVGVRRRKTQTLYISELVDVRDCSNPTYGKLMVAINVAILHDVIERLPHIDLSLAKGKRLHAGQSRKRPRENTEAAVPVRRSRRRLGEAIDEVTSEEIINELLNRKIALLYLQHGNYHSSSPSFFRRPNSLGRQRSYRYDDCLTLLLGKKLGQGAIGEVYEAQVEVDMPSGRVAHYTEKVIVKLALSGEQKERLRHEYSIYRRLLYGPVPVAAGDIPIAFGFFEDIESDAGALILSYNGQSLAYRSDPPASGITVSEEEKAILLRILESIHAAGVAHGDIRTWNMVADGEGKLSIIDFDRAKFRGHKLQMKAEHERLEDLLDGEPIDGFSVTSYEALTTSDEASY